MSFWKWWLFNDKEFTLLKILLIYSVITTPILFLHVSYFPDFWGVPVWGFDAVVFLFKIMHGSLITLIYCIYKAIQFEYKLYKDDVVGGR